MDFMSFFSLHLSFYNLFFYIIKKIILIKNHVIKLYEVTKIKEYGENYCSPNTYCTVDYNNNS